MLGVEQAHRPQLGMPGECVAGDQTTGVVSHRREIPQAQQVHDAPHRDDVSSHRELGAPVEPAGSGAGQD